MSGGIEIDGAVAVVTGATSGIGRATAVGLAERGASVALAARSEDDLEEVAATCRDAGGRALAVPTDVSREDDVEKLAARTIEAFGGFNVWINDAAVMAYGAFSEIPPDTYRQVLETNLFGTIHGARAALGHFYDRGRGVLLNVDSLYGRVSTPYVSPYVVSKFGVRGLSLSLRQETARTDGIDVCTVLPEAVDTPIFSHAANYTGTDVTALPLTVDPDRVVRAIVRCIERPQREVIVGVAGRFFAWGRALAPRAYVWVTSHLMDRLAFRDGTTATHHGNVFSPEPELNQVDGGWREQRRRLRRTVAAGAVAMGAAPLAAWLRHRRHDTRKSRWRPA